MHPTSKEGPDRGRSGPFAFDFYKATSKVEGLTSCEVFVSQVGLEMDSYLKGPISVPRKDLWHGCGW